MNFSNNEDNIIFSILNSLNNKPFLLKKMSKSSKNKKKFNKSPIKTKLSKYSTILSNLDLDSDINSLNKNNNIFNELLQKSTGKNIKKILLKDLLRDTNLLKENKKLFQKSNVTKFMKNSNIKNNTLHKKRINSARPLILDYNKRFEEIENIINFKNENNNYRDIPKILAFKENIFVHEKNISLFKNENLDTNTNDIFSNNSKINNSISNNNIAEYHKNKSKIIPKYKRPKSATYIPNNQKINKILNNLELNDISIKNQKDNNKVVHNKSDKKYGTHHYDLSYINKNIKNMDKKQRQKRNLFKINKEDLTSLFSDLSESLSEKKLINNDIKIDKQNYPNIDDIHIFLNTPKKILKKVNRGHMFRRRPIPLINEKYLIHLPKDIKKDIKNKYNFFSYLITENIYYNTAENKKLYLGRNFKNNTKNSFEDQKNNKLNHNLTEVNYNRYMYY